MRDLHELPELRDSMSYLYVFPTRVGVNRSPIRPDGAVACIPHTRGGEPAQPPYKSKVRCIPHTRGGEPRTDTGFVFDTDVFPTRVGVNRPCTSSISVRQTYSPHAWGWTALAGAHHVAGISIPHTRGGEPTCPATIHGHMPYSPHAWG